MRRKDREVTSPERAVEIINACDCCRLGLRDGDEVYIIPMNFGFEHRNGQLTLFFHGSKDGRRAAFVPLQKSTSFEMDVNHALLEGIYGCDYSYRYSSVMGTGKLTLAEGEEKLRGLEAIMRHYSGKGQWRFKTEALERIQVLKLSVEKWSCKEHL